MALNWFDGKFVIYNIIPIYYYSIIPMISFVLYYYIHDYYVT